MALYIALEIGPNLGRPSHRIGRGPRTTGETAGFMKVLIEGAGDRILGFAMIGPEAGEVMAQVGFLHQFGGAAAGAFGQVALGQGLQPPGDAFDQPDFVVRRGWLAEHGGEPGP
jgi:hypothetical protein